MPPDNAVDAAGTLTRMMKAAVALDGIPSLAAGVDVLATLAAVLAPAHVGHALVFLRAEEQGPDAPEGGASFSLRASAPAPAPAMLPPDPVLARAAASSDALTWTPAHTKRAGPHWWLLPLGNGILALELAAPLAPELEIAYRLLAVLGAQALELVVLRGQAGRGVAEISLLDQVSAAVNSSLSLDAILDEALAALRQVIPFDGGSIALINGRNELELRATYGETDEAARHVRIPVGQGITGWVAAQGRPYLSNDLDQESDVRPVGRSTGTNRKMAAYMAVPITVEDRVIGILQLNSPVKQAFSGRDLALLAEVAERCALAVQRARMFSEMQARSERLSSLAQIARRISAALDLDELFRTCYEQVRRVMPADAFLVALYDDDRAVVRDEFVIDGEQVYPKSEMPIGEGLTSYVIRERKPLLIGDQGQLPITPMVFGQTEHPSESLLMVPLIFEGRVLGAMSAQAYTAHAYTDADLSLLMTIGNQAAVAVRNAQLYQSERAAQQAKDEFLSLVSHELRTPLTTIKGTAQVMQRRMVRAFSAGQVKTPAEHEARQQDLRQLTNIVTQSDRLNALVNDLLDISRLQSGRFEFYPGAADMATLIRTTVDEYRALSPRHRLIVEAPSSLPGTFDGMRIAQVVTNLISNAVKYAPADTTIRITLDTAAPGLARVRVHDEGDGIPAEEQAQLFERFYRAAAVRSNPRSGLGLGLYISRQIVEWHGGQIGVESAAGTGTTFAFTLPLAGPPPAP
ncbi:MAG TPA: GAF domain-containing protein [Chloroflexia bacterium]|nr:GAF domain-containing protein [Chloroflexia bacterium]